MYNIAHIFGHCIFLFIDSKFSGQLIEFGGEQLYLALNIRPADGGGV